MGFDASPLSPDIGVIVVPEIGQQETGFGFMDDDADVAAGAHRPEMGIPGPLDPVKIHPRRRGVHLQVERRRLGGLLLGRLKTCRRRGEGGGDTKFHYGRTQFSTISPGTRPNTWSSVTNVALNIIAWAAINRSCGASTVPEDSGRARKSP